jgi:hypothetical protein
MRLRQEVQTCEAVERVAGQTRRRMLKIMCSGSRGTRVGESAIAVDGGGNELVDVLIGVAQRTCM